jgi:hypothetical protein
MSIQISFAEPLSLALDGFHCLRVSIARDELGSAFIGDYDKIPDCLLFLSFPICRKGFGYVVIPESLLSDYLPLTEHKAHHIGFDSSLLHADAPVLA